MRDRAWTMLAAVAWLVLVAAGAGPPARAADADQPAGASEALHPPPYPYADPPRDGDTTPDQSAQADAPPPETAPAPAGSPEPDATPPPDAIATQPSERDATSPADAGAEDPATGFVKLPEGAADAPSADAPSTDASSTDAPSLDTLSDQASDADQAPASASATVSRLAGWAVSSGDAGGSPFVVIDKPAAQVFLFDPSGALLGSAPALLGSAVGDDTAPGVGDKELADIPMEDRTTPAGRFVAHIGPAEGFRSVLWVDVPSATSLHAVITNDPQERRLERLKSPNPDDRRITHGCINVPARFYGLVRGTFAGRDGVVYILPDTKPVEAVLPSFADETQPPAPEPVAEQSEDPPGGN